VGNPAARRRLPGALWVDPPNGGLTFASPQQTVVVLQVGRELPPLFVGQLDIERFINIGDILDGLGLRLAEDEERGTGVLIHGDRDTRPGQADLNLFVLPKSGTDKTAKIGFWRLSVGSLGIPETFGPAGAAIPSNSLLPP